MITLPDSLRPQEGQTNGGGPKPPDEPLLLMAAAEMGQEGAFDRQPRSGAEGAIERAAERHGMDPAVLKGIAGIESSMNPESNRYRSTQYKGLFQIGREEWAQYGRGGDIFDADQNADAAARMLKDHGAWFKDRYGRSPEAGELYMMHQQGRGFYSHGTMTNIGGNPYPGMRGSQTPASFEAGWAARLGREIAQYGGGPTAEQAASMTHEALPKESLGVQQGREFYRRAFGTMKETVLTPVRAVQAAKDLTERAMAGEDVSVDPDIGPKALQAVSGAGGLGRLLTGGAPKGSIGVFGGRMQQGWDSALEDLATKAEKEGIHPNKIWKGTGLFRGAEGKWRNEIPDTDFRLVSAAKGLPAQGKLPQLIEHPALFEKYPELKNAEYRVRHGEGAEYTGVDSRGVHQFVFGEKQLKADLSTILHEVQHAIQEKEGFATGGSPSHMMASSAASAGRAVQWNLAAWQNYARLAGEVEAKNVQRRLLEGTEKHPQSTEEFPRWEQYMSTKPMLMEPDAAITNLRQGGTTPLAKIPSGHDPFKEAARLRQTMADTDLRELIKHLQDHLRKGRR